MRGDGGGKRKRMMEGGKRGREGKGKGEGEGGRGAGREGEGREEARQVRGGKNSRSLARLSWPRMQSRLALLGQTGLATAKPHSSLPLAVADPNFLQSLLFSRLYSINSHRHLRSSSLLGSHMARSLRRQQSSYDAYFHTCLFPLTSSHIQIFPIQLDAFHCLGLLFPFPLSICRSISPILPHKRGLHTPRNDVNHHFGSS
jgi:hypothetical protein